MAVALPALEMPQDLPDGVLVDRWFAEPVKAVFLPTAIFLTNKAGYPVLSKGHQAVLRRFMQVPSPVPSRPPGVRALHVRATPSRVRALPAFAPSTFAPRPLTPTYPFTCLL